MKQITEYGKIMIDRLEQAIIINLEQQSKESTAKVENILSTLLANQLVDSNGLRMLYISMNQYHTAKKGFHKGTFTTTAYYERMKDMNKIKERLGLEK